MIVPNQLYFIGCSTGAELLHIGEGTYVTYKIPDGDLFFDRVVNIAGPRDVRSEVIGCWMIFIRGMFSCRQRFGTTSDLVYTSSPGDTMVVSSTGAHDSRSTNTTSSR